MTHLMTRNDTHLDTWEGGTPRVHDIPLSALTAASTYKIFK